MMFFDTENEAREHGYPDYPDYDLAERMAALRQEMDIDDEMARQNWEEAMREGHARWTVRLTVRLNPIHPDDPFAWE